MKSLRSFIVAPGVVAILSLLSSANGQVMLDASKITCDQYVHGKVGSPRIVAAWLSGYYHGKRDSAVIDRKAFEDRLIELENFCYQEKNFEMPVMQALEQTLAKTK